VKKFCNLLAAMSALATLALCRVTPRRPRKCRLPACRVRGRVAPMMSAHVTSALTAFRVMPLQVFSDQFVGRVEATNAILRFAHRRGGPVSAGVALDVLESRWDVERKLISCVRVAQWPTSGAVGAPVDRKRKSLL